MRNQVRRCALAFLIASTAGTLQAADPSCTPCGCLPQPLTCAAPAFPNGNGQCGSAMGMAGQGTDPNGQPMQTGDPDDFSDIRGGQSGYFPSTIAFGGLGIASAAATGVGGPANFGPTNFQSSLISPGLLTASTVQPTVPTNRIFGGYSYYDAFQVTTLLPPIPGAANPVTSRQAGFNLNVFNIGIEKTVFCGNASVYIQAPFLIATDNVTQQGLNGVGDISVGFKSLIFATEDKRTALSAGLTVATPTARSGQFATNQTFTFGGAAPGAYTLTTTTMNVNPTIIQPWVSGIVTMDRLFVQNYFGVMIPTTGQVVSSANENLAIGYRMWEGSDRMITSITPIFNTQVLIPLQGSGAPTPIGFPTQTFLTQGVQLGIGQRASVFGGITEPVTGPQAFNLGATFGFNLLY